tara:strand:+ start:1221 stop:2309 length:1089 start_codon:yes stop_codon:yes gene_type:complete
MKNKYLQKIAIFIMVLVISIPFYTSGVLAEDVKFDQAWGLYDITLPDPDDACTEKSEDIEDFIEFMDSDLIQTLTDITSILYGISVIIDTVNGITSTLVVTIPGNIQKCNIPVIGYPLCAAATYAFWTTEKIARYWNPIKVVVMCQAGDDVSWPFHSWCSDTSFINLGGKDRYRFDPFENIYTAVACLCPTAVLFNLRKLKLIYQTHNCCIESMCDKGYSVEGCYQYLDSATCMYWEGSILEMLWDLIVKIVAYYIVAKVVETVLIQVLGFSEITVQGFLRIVEVGFAIDGLQDAFDTLEDRFEEPDCTALLEDIGMYENATASDIDTTGILTDDEGVYNDYSSPSGSVSDCDPNTDPDCND